MYKGKSSVKERFKNSLTRVSETMEHCLSLHHPEGQDINEVEFKETREEESVTEYVKEGHVAVLAVKCEKPQRYIVKLSCLTNPAILRLLEQAGEEYGFKHKGPIAIPCAPEDLERILQEGGKEDS